ncbi:MAG: hypothetical protein KatS3mg129_2912 [Leptospiraceae bacterium]|nr:MAG: hypothetical protein KatS3mg129_2912 [Leptospiraceae bacterium]
MNKNKLLLIGIITLAILGIVTIFYLTKEDPVKRQIEQVKKNPPKIPEIKEDVLNNLLIEDNPEGTPRYSDDLTFEQMVALYRKNYGKNITNKWVQIRLIEDLIRTLKEKYPDSWVTELYIMLKAAFPDLADEIFKRFEQYQEYQKWLEDERNDLYSLSPEERQEVLWNKRYEIFGEDVAKEIWAGELKSQELKQTLKEIDQSTGDINDKVQQFKSSIQQIYGENAQDFLSKRNFEVSQTFLQLPSVQKELQNMDSETRYKTLRQIRSSLGMDPDTVKRLEDLDKERDIRWEIGQQYMIEREALIKRGASEEELDKLRLKYFNPEMAEILKQEEESGFFRFKEQRVYGVN